MNPPTQCCGNGGVLCQMHLHFRCMFFLLKWTFSRPENGLKLQESEIAMQYLVEAK